MAAPTTALIEATRTELATGQASPDRNPAAVYLRGLAGGHGRRTMRTALNRIAELAGGTDADGRPAFTAETMPWHLLRYAHTRAIRETLASSYAPATANKHLSALRGVLREAWRLELLDAETYHRAVDLPGVRGSSLPRGRALEANELAALFHVCRLDETPAGARDATILALGFGAGLRRAEIVSLDLADYTAETGELLIREGKGRKERAVFMENGAKAALEEWLKHRGDAEGPLLCPVLKNGRVELRRMTAQAVYLACAKRAREAGVRSFTPHDLRRSCVSAMLDAGVDLATVARHAGHASPTTTQRYDRRGERALKHAAASLVVPYAPR